MKITLLTMGTRGDVEPFAVIGKALVKKGHLVTICTSKNFLGLIKEYDLAFHPIENDYEEILNSEEGKKILKANPFAIKKNLEKWIYPLVEQSLNEFYILSKEADLVIYHVKTMADVFATVFPGKMIRAMVVPAIQPTRDFPSPAFSGFAIPSFLNRWSYKLLELGLRMMRKPIRRFKEKNSISPSSATDTLFIYGISPSFLARPNDYPPNQYFTGFWFPDRQGILPAEVKEFIEAGDPPLLITFGSMPFKSKLSIEKLIHEIINKFKLRVVLVKGWGIKDTESLLDNKNVLLVNNIPYNILFPHVKAIIHHGGVGTTAECLRAGKPMLICPILYPVGDQQFWGKLSVSAGVGVKPLPLSKMTVSSLLERVHLLLNSPALYQNARELAEKIGKEKGVDNAVALIEGGK